MIFFDYINIIKNFSELLNLLLINYSFFVMMKKDKKDLKNLKKGRGQNEQ